MAENQLDTRLPSQKTDAAMLLANSIAESVSPLQSSNGKPARRSPRLAARNAALKSDMLQSTTPTSGKAVVEDSQNSATPQPKPRRKKLRQPTLLAGQAIPAALPRTPLSDSRSPASSLCTPSRSNARGVPPEQRATFSDHSKQKQKLGSSKSTMSSDSHAGHGVSSRPSLFTPPQPATPGSGQETPAPIPVPSSPFQAGLLERIWARATALDGSSYYYNLSDRRAAWKLPAEAVLVQTPPPSASASPAAPRSNDHRVGVRDGQAVGSAARRGDGKVDGRTALRVVELRRKLRKASVELASCRSQMLELRGAVAEEQPKLLEALRSVTATASREATERVDAARCELDETRGALALARSSLREKDALITSQALRIASLETSLAKSESALQELRGNVRVMCRLRPMRARGGGDDGSGSGAQVPFAQPFRSTEGGVARSVVFSQPAETPSSSSSSSSLASASLASACGIEFERVFGSSESTADVFAELSPVVKAVARGGRAAVLAYGQTGSGKTFTVTGLHRIMVQSWLDSGLSVTLCALEVYNEALRDLCAAGAVAAAVHPRTDAGSVAPAVATRTRLASALEADAALAAAVAKRATADNGLNAHSSRSHLLLVYELRSASAHKGAGESGGGSCAAASAGAGGGSGSGVLLGQLALVDLAGSERLGRTAATGNRRCEGNAINKSLSALGAVMLALSKHSGTGFVPYRNSRLTHVLQPLLSRGSRVHLLVHASSDAADAAETLSTLHFAARCKAVMLGAATPAATSANSSSVAAAASAVMGAGATAQRQRQQSSADTRTGAGVVSGRAVRRTPSGFAPRARKTSFGVARAGEAARRAEERAAAATAAAAVDVQRAKRAQARAEAEVKELQLRLAAALGRAETRNLANSKSSSSLDLGRHRIRDTTRPSPRSQGNTPRGFDRCNVVSSSACSPPLPRDRKGDRLHSFDRLCREIDACADAKAPARFGDASQTSEVAAGHAACMQPLVASCGRQHQSQQVHQTRPLQHAFRLRLPLPSPSSLRRRSPSPCASDASSAAPTPRSERNGLSASWADARARRADGDRMRGARRDGNTALRTPPRSALKQSPSARAPKAWRT